jgi:hypothetical protein
MIPALSLEDASLVGEHPAQSGIKNIRITYLISVNIFPVYNRLINKVQTCLFVLSKLNRCLAKNKFLLSQKTGQIAKITA